MLNYTTNNMELFRLDIGNNDSIILRFPDRATAEKYLCFGDDGYDLANILLAIRVNTNGIGYIELGEITDHDTIIDFRHFKLRDDDNDNDDDNE